jgi:putative ABC transport system permease protein
MRSLWVAGLLLRRIRAERGMLVLLFAVIAATSFLFAAAPRLFNRISDDALRYAVRTSSAVQRNLVLALVSNISPGTGGVSAVRAEGEQLAAHFPPSVDTLIIERSLRLTTARFSVTHPPSYDTFLSLRYQDGMTDATRLVSGRWPVDRGVPLRSTNFGAGSDQAGGGEPAEPVVLEAALATAEAAEIGVKVGDRLAVTMDPSDLAGTQFEIAPTAVLIVGLYEPRELSAEYWSGDASLLHVSQAGTPDHPVAYATAYFPAEMYPSLAQDGMPFRYEWHFTIDPQRLDAGQVGELQDGLRHFDFISAASAIGEPGTVEVRTGLLPILDDYAAQRSAAESILSLAAIGPIGLAGGVLGMVAILVVTRRRAALTLARSRGASGPLVLGTQLWEAIVLAGVASLIGLLAAILMIPARASSLSPVLAVAVGTTALLLLLGATWPMAQRPLGQSGRADPPVLHASPRRLVTELTIVGIAIGGILLLRQRGLTAAGETGSVASFDPLLAAAPALSGLAAGVIALRLYPLPIRGLGWLAARRRDLVPVLGLRTIGRHPTAANLPLLVLMLTAAFGAFSSVIMSSIDRGQVFASYLEVGADYRIEKIGTGSLGSPQDLAASGVAAEAPGILDPSADFASTATQRATIYLDAVDPRAYQEVVAGSPADPRWPDAFLGEPTGVGLGTERNPIPAILSSQLPVGSGSLVSGNTFRITVAGQEMAFRLIQRRATFPGIGEPASFAVVPFNWVQVAFANRALRPSVMWLRARQPIGLATLAATVAEEPSSIRVISRYDAYAALHDPPMGTAVSIGYGLALGVAVIYMALAIIGAVVLSAVRRTQDLAYLRTLGVTPSQALGLSLVEHAPPVLLALLPGAALGIGVAFLLEPGLQLDPFVGTSGVPLFVDWSRVALLVAALTGVVLAAVTVGTWLSRRARLVNVSRMGED